MRPRRTPRTCSASRRPWQMPSRSAWSPRSWCRRAWPPNRVELRRQSSRSRRFPGAALRRPESLRLAGRRRREAPSFREAVDTLSGDGAQDLLNEHNSIGYSRLRITTTSGAGLSDHPRQQSRATKTQASPKDVLTILEGHEVPDRHVESPERRQSSQRETPPIEVTLGIGASPQLRLLASARGLRPLLSGGRQTTRRLRAPVQGRRRTRRSRRRRRAKRIPRPTPLVEELPQPRRLSRSKQAIDNGARRGIRRLGRGKLTSDALGDRIVVFEPERAAEGALALAQPRKQGNKVWAVR